MITAQASSSKRLFATMLSAIVAAMASSLCCIGPLIYLLFGVSAAGLSGVKQLGWLQYPMLVLSSGLLISGFWRLYLVKRPVCTGRFSLTKMRVLYWLSLPLVLAFQLYPYLLPWILERLA